MLTAIDMLMRAERCEEMADRAISRYTVHALRGAAEQWRNIAVQMDLLEREPAYQRLRARDE
jgi:hypothetical protein